MWLVIAVCDHCGFEDCQNICSLLSDLEKSQDNERQVPRYQTNIDRLCFCPFVLWFLYLSFPFRQETWVITYRNQDFCHARIEKTGKNSHLIYSLD